MESPLLLIYIPDGHTKEVPNKAKQVEATKLAVQKPHVLQKQYKKATDREKECKPGDCPDSAAEIAAAEESTALLLYKKIEAQGELVRAEKARDAKSESTKAAVTKLLELKNEFKVLTGQEYKLGQVPTVGHSVSGASSNVAESAHVLYAEIELQGEVVRKEKQRDAKSENSIAAIAKLLELKKRFKSLTGQEYKAGRAPAVVTSTCSTTAFNASLYNEIEAQGDLVRREKANDAKSDATKAAIFKLLELKKQYEECTGQPYKPGQAPAVTTSSKKSSDSLREDIKAQGELVRNEKKKLAKLDTSKAAMQKLLELKKLYKESTGEEYKPE